MKNKIFLFALLCTSSFCFGNLFRLFGNKEERNKAMQEIIQQVVTPEAQPVEQAAPVQPSIARQGNPLSTQLDLVSAVQMAEFSALAYQNPESIQAALSSKGFHQWRFFSAPRTDGQAYVAWNNSYGILAFRGTEPDSWKDFLTDARFKLVTWNGKGRVHRGFAESFEELWSESGLGRFMHADAQRPWIIVGHSMGAGLATLAASRFPGTYSLYTFGSPRTGNREFAQSITRPVFRFVNQSDPVVDVPPYVRGLDIFDHCGQLYQITPDMKIENSRTPNILSTRMSLGALLGGGFNGAEWQQALQKGIQEHMPQAYLNALQSL